MSAVGGEIQQLVVRAERAHGEAKTGTVVQRAWARRRLAGVKAVVEEAPVEVELKAWVGVGEGEVLPERDIGGEAAGSEAAGGMGKPIAELGEEGRSARGGGAGRVSRSRSPT